MTFDFKPELIYVALLFALFILPRFLQRFRIPTPITSILLGIVAGIGFQLFEKDSTLELLASFGIISLFLFAGLDIDFHEIRTELRVILQHIAILLTVLFGIAWLVLYFFDLPFRPSLLVALALLTPSTGFILDSLNSLVTTQQEKFWIRSMAIAAELVALGVFFVVLQSATVERLSISLAALVGLVVLIPILFWVFAKWVVHYAPKSEFAFLIMVAVISSYITRELGVYYLVGAFIVGVVAQRFRTRLPALTSENMLHAVEVFASFFISFYFFSAGLHIREGNLSINSVLYAAIFLIVVIPIRLMIVSAHRRFSLREPWKQAFRISIAIMPTLVFSIVIADILREQFAVSDELLGGIVLYTLVNTLLPSFVFRLPAPELDANTIPDSSS